MCEQLHEEYRDAGCHGDLEEASPEERKDESREECHKSCDGALGCLENSGEGHYCKGHVGNVIQKRTHGLVFDLLANKRQGKNSDKKSHACHNCDVNIDIHTFSSLSL